MARDISPGDISPQHWVCQPEGINKDPTVGLDGGRQPRMHIFKNKMCWRNSKLGPTRALLFIEQFMVRLIKRAFMISFIITAIGAKTFR